jgi:acyl transferase domain-containing protein/acyl carrier protein
MSVFHVAGRDHFDPVASLSLEDLNAVLAAKVDGARHLDEVLGDRELDAFVLFSSIAGIWGSGYQAAYAAANAFLDGLVFNRRSRGLTATAVAWGPWADGGMAAETGAEESLRRRGLKTMPAAQAILALQQALAEDRTTLTVADMDWATFAPTFTVGRPSPLLTGVLAAGTTSAGNSELADRLSGLTGAEQDRVLVDLVRSRAAAVLGHGSAGSVAADRAFKDLGFDSLTAVELRNSLTEETGLSLPTTLVFDHPNAIELARLLKSDLLGTAADTGNTRPVTAVVADDPVVIVGMSCRYPGGVRSPEDLWRLVFDGVDAIGEFPVDRDWDVERLYDPNARAGHTYTRYGGFLYDAADFDADFFGISPREAVAMDPQQRLLLETSWELFERAGIDPRSVRGSQVGVFIGSGYQDYAAQVRAADGAGGYVGTGTSGSVISGRLAYTFGLRGPAVTVDTACSSSLVALHLAAQAVRAGECSMAIAGGVMVMTTPGPFIEFSRQGGLARDGRCKAFAAAADGTGWSEGVGVLLVERLSDARRHGHEVLAVVRGSAVNQDGASNGLTAPNGPAQQRVIRQALASAGLSASDVDVVEGHGTGTRLGDPIEARALLATYGCDRDRPLWLGSLKSNIGHAQAASGVGGVIKMVMAMRHGVLPRTLHVDEPTPHVDWSVGDVRLLTERRDWPVGECPRRAGVSSFGVSGTNAHTIIESCDEVDGPADEAPASSVVPWPLSGKNAQALRAQAQRLLDTVDSQVPDLAAVGRTLATRRAALDCRAVLVGTDAHDLRAGLAALADGQPAATVITGEQGSGRIAFLFSGQGSQRVGMGRELYAAFPVFATAYDEVADRLGARFFDLDEESLAQTASAQRALFASQVALFRLVESWGVRPDVLVGHSVGEIAAAHVAGVLSLDDACRLVSARADLMRALPSGGAMVAIEATEDEVLPYLGDEVSIAAVNGPRAVVVAGSEPAVQSVVENFTDRKSSRLVVSHAFHSPLMEPMVDDFAAVVGKLEFSEPRIAMLSPVSEPEYWVRQVRDAVRFADQIAELDAQGVTRFLEIGPGGVLTALTRNCLLDKEILAVPALRADRSEATAAVTALSQLHVHGVDVDWTRFFPGARAAGLPTYAFQPQRYWMSAPAETEATVDPAEAGFWSTVESQDAAGLAETLGMAPGELDHILPRLSAWRQRRRAESAVAGWRYRVSWQPVDTTDHQPTGLWLVINGDELIDFGATRLTITVEPTADRATLVSQIEEAVHGQDAPVAGVLSLLVADDTVFALAQALGDAGIAAPLWCVTRGAVSTGPADPVTNPAQAKIWGLGRVIALEHSGRWGGLIDLPAEVDDRVVARIAAVIAGAGEDQVAVRASGVLARRLVHASAGAPGVWRARGTALVTGGTGALGGHVARWLATSGVEHVVLTSRGGLDAPGAVELMGEIESMGARATVVACDVADRTQLEDLLTHIDDLTTVVHTAGVDHLTPLADLTPDEYAAVLSAKADGARHLDELLGDQELDAFVLFSSIAGIWGSGHQAAYAAANAYLDGLAYNRRARGLAATAVAWGPWGDGGMAEGEAEDQLRRRGLSRMPAQQAITALRGALADNETALTVVDVDWTTFAPTFTLNRPSPLLSGVPGVEQALAAGEDVASAGSELVSRLAGLSEAEQDRTLIELVRSRAALVLGHGATVAVETDRAFRDMGFDSLTAVELRNSLSTETGLSLPSTVVFDYPDATELGRYIRSDLLGTAADTGNTRPVTAVVADDPVVIVGMSCRYPGGVRSPEDLWRLVFDGVDAIGEFPVDRDWDVERLYDPNARAGHTYTRYGGFLYDAADFDADFFGISPREAVAMDPQQRLLLETSWELFERAGIDPRSVRGSQVGVFIGSGYQDYAAQVRAADGAGGYVGTGTSGSVISGRLAYTFGLRGPAVTVDTACSSSLVALHLAAQAVRAGECSMAIAGGVMVMTTPGPFIEFSRQGGLARDGRCKAFAAAADGTGWSEGVGVLLVERLSDARRHGHEVLAVVRGSAVNQDGASNGLTAPNGPAQQRVIRQALASAGLSASDVDVVEGHGTGTRLGDPIEARALLATYGCDRDRPLWLGSLKSNIGHAQAASGVGGVIKMVMAMRHGVLPRTLHVDEPTPHVDWSVGDVRLLTERRDWPVGECPRRAGVSSFGVSGTNAHTIIESCDEVDGPADEAPASSVVPWPLSGKNAQALRAQAQRLLDTVDSQVPDLAAVGRTLATRRAALDCRAVLVGTDAHDLRAGLAALADGQPAATVITGEQGSGRIAFLFSGQGSQRVGMGRELYAAFPVFATAYDEVADRLGARFFDLDEESLAQTASAQRALFASQVALFRLVESWGVRPDVLVGHSVGEIAAAHVAGVLSLDDACRLVSARADLMRALPSGGAMVAIEATEDEVLPYLGDEVSIAAVNGPRAVVVAGSEPAVQSVVENFTDRKSSRLVVSHAFHSPLMEPMVDDFAAVVGKLEFSEPRIAMLSPVSEPEYWVRQVRDAVRFADQIAELDGRGVARFLEIGPGGVLTALTRNCLLDKEILAVPALRAERSEVRTATSALALLYVGGVEVDWTPFLTGGGRIALPTYPFQHRRHWLEARPAVTTQAVDPVESEFWETVERGDLGSLATALDVDTDDRFSDVLPRLSAWRRQRRQRSAADRLRYTVTWRAMTDLPPAELSGTWLVVVPRGTVTSEPVAAVLRGLVDHGATPQIMTVTPAADRATLAGRLTGIDMAGVVSLLAVADATPTDVMTSAVLLVQALTDAGIEAPLWCLTRSAVSTGAADPLRDPAQSLVWGMGLVAALEHAGMWGGLVDLPDILDERALAGLASVLTGRTGEDQVAVRSSGVLTRRLRRFTPNGQAHSWSPQGTVLVTGGTGGLGAHVARWLARGGAQHLVLTSRRGERAPGAAELCAELEALGVQVTIAACDISDRAAVAALLNQIEITAVMHAAGVSDAAMITDTTPKEIADSLSAKVNGAMHLDELLADRELDAFVMFSSISGVWGGGGQAAYAAGNAFLDALAAARRARGVTATAVAWGPWGGGGMVADTGDEERLGARGLTPLSPDLALIALQRALDENTTATVVADVDWRRFIIPFTITRPSPLLGDLDDIREAPVGQNTTVDTGSVRAALRESLAEVPDGERQPILLDLVRTNVAGVLGHGSPDQVEPGRAFRELGFDSLTAIELRDGLTSATGLRLPVTLVFDHPTPDALARHLLAELLPDAADPGTSVFGELDRLESAIAMTGDDSAVRPRIRTRLQDLLARLNGVDETATDRLAAATVDDIFDLVDRELDAS